LISQDTCSKCPFSFLVLFFAIYKCKNSTSKFTIGKEVQDFPPNVCYHINFLPRYPISLNLIGDFTWLTEVLSISPSPTLIQYKTHINFVENTHISNHCAEWTFQSSALWCQCGWLLCISVKMMWVVRVRN